MPFLTTLATASANGFKQLAKNLLNLTWSNRTFNITIPTSIVTASTYAQLSSGNYYVLFRSTSGNAYIYSQDGISWSAATIPSIVETRCMATNGSRLVAANPSYSYVSTNGATWTVYSMTSGVGSEETINELIWDGTRFLATTSSSNNYGLIYSVDGTSWSPTSITTNVSTIETNSSGLYVATKTSTAVAYYTSGNPTSDSWSSSTLPASKAWIGLTYGNGLFLASVVTDTLYATSPNGVTWTARTFPVEPGGNGDSVETMYYNGAFYYYRLDNLYKSTDGITWSIDKTFSSSNLDTVVTWISAPNELIGLGVTSGTSAPTGPSSTYIVGV